MPSQSATEKAQIAHIVESVLEGNFSAFAEAPRNQQNSALDSLRKSKELFQVLAETIEQVEFEAVPAIANYSALHSLHFAYARQDWPMFRPAVRRLLVEFADNQYEADPDEPDLASLLDEYGLDVDPSDSAAVHQAVTEAAALKGGPVSWQQIFALCHLGACASDNGDLISEGDRLQALAMETLLSSRRVLKVVKIWDDIWQRVPLIDSDMYYHDSRLRRALLDKNLDHSFRLIAASIKSGLTAQDVVGHFVKAMYDIDFADPQQMAVVPLALQALVHADWDPKSKKFQYAMARIAYDVMHFERTPKERIEYDQISLLKSRDILIDFRRGFMQSVFLQAWGIAEYAFVHGFEPTEILDEVYRVSGAIGKTPQDNRMALGHLWATSDLIASLHEEYSLYLLAYAIRYLVRQPKVKAHLDPFPDEQE